MKHNVEAFKKYYINATKEEVIEDMFLDNCNLQQEIERLNNIINKAIEYIEQNQEKQYAMNYEYALSYNELPKLLDILKGSDK